MVTNEMLIEGFDEFVLLRIGNGTRGWATAVIYEDMYGMLAHMIFNSTLYGFGF
jgi:hypothetical protein